MMSALADPSTTRQTLDNVSQFLHVVGHNLGRHVFSLVAGLGLGVLVAVVIVYLAFGEDNKKEGKWIRKLATAVVNIMLPLSILGGLQLVWYLAAENNGAEPLITTNEVIKGWDDFLGYGGGALWIITVVLGITTFLRLRRKYVSWIPALFGMLGLVVVVNFFATAVQL
jgi:ABC-type amino acid transport system permease subunit